MPRRRVAAEARDGGVGDGVAAVHAELLGRRGRAEAEVARYAAVRAPGLDRVLEREEDGRAEEEGRLADGLGRVDAVHVVRAVEELLGALAQRKRAEEFFDRGISRI